MVRVHPSPQFSQSSSQVTVYVLRINNCDRGALVLAPLLKDNSIIMLVYKCDGQSFSTGKKCNNEAKDELPTRWLLISGKIVNGLYDAHYLEANGTWHFCSRRCLENFLFKDVNPASGQSGVNNMQDPNLQAGQQEPTEQATTEQVAAVEQEAQEQAMESE